MTFKIQNIQKVIYKSKKAGRKMKGIACGRTMVDNTDLGSNNAIL